jgi:hypothetical protein
VELWREPKLAVKDAGSINPDCISRLSIGYFCSPNPNWAKKVAAPLILYNFFDTSRKRLPL